MSDQDANRLGPPEGGDDRGMSPVGSGRTMSMGRTAAAVGFAAAVLVLLWWMNMSEKVAVAPPPAPAGAKMASELVSPPPPPPKPPVPQVSPPTPAAVGPPPVPAPTDQAAEMGRRAPVMAFTSSKPTNAPGAAAKPGATITGPAGGIGAAMVTTPIQRVKAVSLGDPTYRLSAGTVIPCVLDSAIDTTTAGFVRCHLEQDIYSASGALVLLDAGTVVLGEYGGGGGLKPGQERIGVVWSRAETPNSVAVNLASPASDSLGRAGMDGEVETYFWTRFGSAIMFSLIQDAASIGRVLVNNATSGGNYNGYPSYGTNTQAAGEQLAATALRNQINIPPILRKNQGERVSIFVRNDLDFSDVYKLSTR